MDSRKLEKNVAGDILREYLQIRESDPGVKPQTAINIAAREIERHHRKYPPQHGLRSAAQKMATAISDGLAENVLYDGLITLLEHLIAATVLSSKDDLDVLVNRMDKDFSEFDPAELASRARAEGSYVADALADNSERQFWNARDC